MATKTRQLVIWHLLFLVMAYRGSAKACASFEVQPVITAAENENVTILFNMKVTKECSGPDRFFLRVSKGNHVLCSLMHYKWECQQPLNSPKCTCKTKDRPYKFTHTVHRSDNPPAIWAWFTDGDNAQNLSVTFNVTYPAQVTNLSFLADNALVTSPVNPGKALDIVCTYDAGNPPVDIHLLDRHGAILQIGTDGLGKIRYRFAAVGCGDYGHIRCQAPGASHNKSAPLLIRCLFPSTTEDGNVTNTLAFVTGVLASIAIIITITLCVIVIYRFRMFTAFQGRFVFRNGPVNPRNMNVGLPPPQPAPQNNQPPMAVYVCHADDEPEVVFEPANEEAMDRGPPPGMNQCATSDKIALDGDSSEIVGKPRQHLFLRLNGASPFVLDTDGASTSTSDAGTINGPDGKPDDPPKPCTYTESADDVTYVPISDILAKKRRKDVAATDVAAEDVASKDGQAEDDANVSVTMELATHSVSYSSLNFDRRPPITAPRLSSRPSCFYTRLADMDTDTESSPHTHDDPERDK